MRAPLSRDQLHLFLAVSMWAAAALMAYSALTGATAVQDHGRRFVEAAGGLAIGAFVPASIHTGWQTRRIRVVGAMVAALAFYAAAPWGWIW